MDLPETTLLGMATTGHDFVSESSNSRLMPATQVCAHLITRWMPVLAFEYDIGESDLAIKPVAAGMIGYTYEDEP